MQACIEENISSLVVSIILAALPYAYPAIMSFLWALAFSCSLTGNLDLSALGFISA